ncbi:unnamed protein product [Arabis nemorensis]|uniref:Neprosin PEP catalytic domain-containing protein n=1 Tax=Arabis nemorensis TaxID=586526 RepID=A0A565BV87_9BRAS|nr:unnamed protein product [Arabis nemorensis]
MLISINDPKVKLPQYSSSRMHVQIGDDFIQMGWTVNPMLYSDSKPRFFMYTKAGEHKCYNSMCPAGFISVRSDIPLGHVLPTSIRGVNSFINTHALLKNKPSDYLARLVASSELPVHIYNVQSSIPKDPVAIWISEFVQAEELFKQPADTDNCLRGNRGSHRKCYSPAN